METRVKNVSDIQNLSWFQGVDWDHIRWVHTLKENLRK